MPDVGTDLLPLARAAVREYLFRVLPWLVAIPALPAGSAAAYDWVLPNAHSRHDLTLTVSANPAFKLIFGPLESIETRDDFVAWHSLTLGCFFTALMAVLVVVRASRGDEDSGQAELIASAVANRGTRLLVAAILVVLVSVAVGGATLGATLLAGGGPAPTAALAAGFVASGLVFGACGAVAAQIGASAPTARVLAIGALELSFMLRGWVDASDGRPWMTWTTPLAWVQHTHPASARDWRPLLLALLAAVAAGLLAQVLQSRRDFGLGMVAPRTGPDRGGVVATLPGFVWRLNRGPVLAWLAALTLLGAEFGNVATSIGTVISTNRELTQVIATGARSEEELTAAFVVAIVTLLGIVAALPGIHVVTRLAAEEDEHRLEPLLASGVARHQALGLAVAVAALSSAAGVLLGGLAMTIVARSQGAAIAATDLMWQSATCIPAVWSLVALTTASVGVARGAAAVGWLGAAAAFALTFLGPLFKLDDRILSIIPFWHVPDVLTASPNWAPTYWVALVSLALFGIGFTGFRLRDVH